jgi:hypothetical protein
VTAGKNRDGSYWAVIEYRRGVSLEQHDGITRIGRSFWPILTESACNQFDSAISRCHSDRN